MTALADGPCRLDDLCHNGSSTPPTTLRGYLRALARAGVVEKRRQAGFPGYTDYRLTTAGEELPAIVDALATWLAAAPGGPIFPGSPQAKRAVTVLIEGWTTGMVRALAAGPLSLTELDREIAGLSYPSLERRLAALRAEGMVEPLPESRYGTPHAVTGWLRGAIAPLTAAASWERRWMRERTPPIAHPDVEAALLLTLPRLRVAEDISGTCRLAVQIEGDTRTGTAGAIALVREGSVASTGTSLEGSTDAWASGQTSAWLSAVIARNPAGLDLGGRVALAHSLVEGLHAELFGSAALAK